jgi:hypothetical protein
MHPRVGKQLVDIGEAPDVTDLGHERRRGGRSHPWNGEQSLRHLAVEQGCDPRVRAGNLFVQQVVLRD